MHKQESELLLQPIRRFQRSLWLQRFYDDLVLAGLGAVSLFLLLTWAHKLFAFPLPSGVQTGIAAACILLGAITVTGWRKPSLMLAAQKLDQQTQGRERLSSALDIQNHNPTIEPAAWNPCERAVWEDATRWARRIRNHHWFRHRPPNRWKALSIVVLALLLSGFAPQFDLLHRQQKQEKQEAEAKNIRKQVARVERVVEAIGREADKEDLKAVGELTRNMEKALQDMRRRPPARNDALKKLSKLENSVFKEKQKLDPAKTALSRLQENPLTRKMADQLQKGNLEGAKQEAQKLKEELEQGKIDAEQKKQMAADLTAAMKAMQGKTNGLNKASSEQLTSATASENSMESELQATDPAQMLSQMEAQMMEGMSQQGLSDQQMNRILDQIGQAKSEIGGPMKQGTEGQRARLQRMATAGKNGVRFTEQRSGQGSGGNNRLEEEGSTNLEKRGGPSRSWSDRTIPPGEYVKLYDPRRNELPGVDLRSRSGLGEGDIQGTMEVEGAPREESPEVPYREQFESFRSAAEDALTQQQIPLRYRPLVREYFDSVDQISEQPTSDEVESESDNQ